MALKVFRTPIGFHDAYVAAPSQKAALAAWGSDADLFARGMAEVVTDPALTAEPLARPGEVVRRLRGSPAEQLAAAAPVAKKLARSKGLRSGPDTQPQVQRPTRDAVEAAEQALARAEDRQRDDERGLAAEEAGLAEQRRAMRADWLAERQRLEAARDLAATVHADALREWRAAVG